MFWRWRQSALCCKFFLHTTLPRHYTATHWSRTWVVFDSTLILALLRTAHLAGYGEQRFKMSSVGCAAMLVCDTQFDVSTATKGPCRARCFLTA